ncbi:MAG TPA: ester cyclase [Dehalococcoidia bacterium]|nr:ester cyclase [Dehalococcoidia bacterium]
MKLTSTKDLAYQVIDLICNSGELDAADELFTDDYVNHGGLIPDLLRGPEAIKFSVALYRRAFPDFRIEAQSVTTEESGTIVRWVSSCTPSTLNPGDGNQGILRGITRFRHRDGKIAESWTVWDSNFGLAWRVPADLQPNRIP